MTYTYFIYFYYIFLSVRLSIRLECYLFWFWSLKAENISYNSAFPGNWLFMSYTFDMFQPVELLNISPLICNSIHWNVCEVSFYYRNSWRLDTLLQINLLSNIFLIVIFYWYITISLTCLFDYLLKYWKFIYLNIIINNNSINDLFFFIRPFDY